MKIQKKGEWLEITIPFEWNGLTIENILKEIWDVPKGFLHQYRTGKKIKVNNENYPWTKELVNGDKLHIHMFPVEDYGVTPSFLELDILYEDELILIVNKPAGIEIHPTVLGQENTLANYIAYYFLINGIKTKIRHIHRLDKDTTGAVLYAKNALVGALLDKMLVNRLIKRTYLALVEGQVKEKKGKIIKQIGRDRHHSTRRIVSKTGQEAITFFEVLKYYPREDKTLVKLDLQTGRTHQIRVHMSYIGHPLLGDKLYSGVEIGLARQALHAAKITFAHPITNEEIVCFAPFIDNPPIFENNSIELI